MGDHRCMMNCSSSVRVNIESTAESCAVESCLPLESCASSVRFCMCCSVHAQNYRGAHVNKQLLFVCWRIADSTPNLKRWKLPEADICTFSKCRKRYVGASFLRYDKLMNACSQGCFGSARHTFLSFAQRHVQTASRKRAEAAFFILGWIGSDENASSSMKTLRVLFNRMRQYFLKYVDSPFSAFPEVDTYWTNLEVRTNTYWNVLTLPSLIHLQIACWKVMWVCFF